MSGSAIFVVHPHSVLYTTDKSGYITRKNYSVEVNRMRPDGFQPTPKLGRNCTPYIRPNPKVGRKFIHTFGRS